MHKTLIFEQKSNPPEMYFTDLSSGQIQEISRALQETNNFFLGLIIMDFDWNSIVRLSIVQGGEQISNSGECYH